MNLCQRSTNFDAGSKITHTMKIKLIKGILLYFLLVSSLSAHGDLDLRIQEISIQIKLNPTDETLFYQRGVLYFQHEEYKHSIKDLKKAKAKGYRDILLELHLAKDYHKLKKYRKAKKIFEELLEKDGQNVHVLKALARLQMDMGAFEESARNFENLILHAIRSFPENYVEAAKAYRAMGTVRGNAQAIQILEKGIQKLGPAIVLYEELKRFAVEGNQFELAIAAQKEIIKQYTRREVVYFELAKLHFRNGDSDAQMKYLLAAQTALKELPKRIQKTTAMVTLDKKIQSHLTKL